MSDDADTAPLPLAFEQGDDWTFVARLKNPDGSAVNLTGQTPSSNVYTGESEVPVAYLVPDVDPLSVTSLPDGVLQFTVPSSITPSIPVDAPDATEFQTRATIRVLNQAGRLKTFGRVRFKVGAP